VTDYSTRAFVEDPDVASKLLHEALMVGYACLRWDVEPRLGQLEALFEPDAARISHVMEAQQEGRGTYAHLSDRAITPLKPILEQLYEASQRHLATDEAGPWPPTLDEFWDRCRAAGQTESAVLALQHGAGGFNSLHDDAYGDVTYPVQFVLLLSRPGIDFVGGSFLLELDQEQRPHELVVPPFGYGDLLLIRSRTAFIDGRRCRVRHGVSRIEKGHRRTIGMVFHLARRPGDHEPSR